MNKTFCDRCDIVIQGKHPILTAAGYYLFDPEKTKMDLCSNCWELLKERIQGDNRALDTSDSISCGCPDCGTDEVLGV